MANFRTLTTCAAVASTTAECLIVRAVQLDNNAFTVYSVVFSER